MAGDPDVQGQPRPWRMVPRFRRGFSLRTRCRGCTADPRSPGGISFQGRCSLRHIGRHAGRFGSVQTSARERTACLNWTLPMRSVDPTPRMAEPSIRSPSTKVPFVELRSDTWIRLSRNSTVQ